MNISLDTNVILRLILNDVPHRTILVEQLLLETTGQAELADATFVEIEYSLIHHYHLSRPEVVTVIRGLLSHPQINCNRKLFESILPSYLLLPKVSFVDLLLVEYAKLNQAVPLYTFDEKLAKQVDGAKLLS